jgi:hypothetical protein
MARARRSTSKRRRSPPPRLNSAGQRALRLILGNHLDPADVPWILRKRGVDEHIDDCQGLRRVVQPSAQPENVGVVVLAGQRRRFGVVGEGSPDPLHLVRGNLLAVARSADDDPQTPGVGNRSLRGIDAVRRIVVFGIVDSRTTVDDLVTGLG